MMDMVIRWKRTWTPHSVFENIKTFTEASELADKAVEQYGSAESINIFEGHKHVASLRIMR